MRIIVLYIILWLALVLTIVFYSKETKAAIYLCDEVKFTHSKYFICTIQKFNKKSNSNLKITESFYG